MFSTLPKRNFNLSFTLILSSANTFDLDWSKILSFGKELSLYYHTMLPFSKSKVSFGKDFGNNGKCWFPAFSPLPTMFAGLSRTNTVVCLQMLSFWSSLKFCLLVNSFPNKPWFLDVCCTSLLKTLQ